MQSFSQGFFYNIVANSNHLDHINTNFFLWVFLWVVSSVQAKACLVHLAQESPGFRVCKPRSRWSVNHRHLVPGTRLLTIRPSATCAFWGAAVMASPTAIWESQQVGSQPGHQLREGRRDLPKARPAPDRALQTWALTCYGMQPQHSTCAVSQWERPWTDSKTLPSHKWMCRSE